MNKIKVLLLEKEGNDLQIVVNELKQLEYEVFFLSSNNNHLVNEIIEINPDIILIYFNKNNSFNIKIVQYIIKQFNIPVINLIKDLHESQLNEIIKTEACGFLFGPFLKDSLKILISNALYKFKQKRNKILSEEFSINDQIINVLKLQKSLLPKHCVNIDNINFDWLFFPSYYGSGDIFNYFKLGQYHVGFYILDVMGHGFQSALTSTILHKYLLPDSSSGGIVERKKNNSQNNMRRRKEDFLITIVSPREVLMELNKRFYFNGAGNFFTIIYGIINTITYEVKIARAGHHYPLYITKDNKIQILKLNGNAIGISDEINIEEYNFIFDPGARLYLYSDGLVELEKNHNEDSSKDIFIDFLKKNSNIPLESTLKKLEYQILNWADYGKLNDDIALLALERVE